MARNEQEKQVESILAALRTECPVDADDSTRGRLAALAFSQIAKLGIAPGDEQVCARVAAVFSRDVGDLAEDVAKRAIDTAMGK